MGRHRRPQAGRSGWSRCARTWRRRCSSGLFAVAFYILYEAYQRLLQVPAEIQSTGMLVIALLGLVVNLISMRLLSAASGESLNVKGAYLEVWSDMLGSVGVIIAALVRRIELGRTLQHILPTRFGSAMLHALKSKTNITTYA